MLNYKGALHLVFYECYILKWTTTVQRSVFLIDIMRLVVYSELTCHSHLIDIGSLYWNLSFA